MNTRLSWVNLKYTLKKFLKYVFKERYVILKAVYRNHLGQCIFLNYLNKNSNNLLFTWILYTVFVQSEFFFLKKKALLQDFSPSSPDFNLRFYLFLKEYFLTWIKKMYKALLTFKCQFNHFEYGCMPSLWYHLIIKWK